MNPLDDLQTIRQKVQAELKEGKDVQQIRRAVLGRQGSLTQLLKLLPNLSVEERRRYGQPFNQAKSEIAAWLETADQSIDKTQQPVDFSIPPLPFQPGTIHPISSMIEEMTAIFSDLSFEVVEGSEIVTEEENFESLNIGSEHPARDSHDSFYIDKNLLLRTQMTAVQVEEVRKRAKRGELPIRIVAPGRTYRRESDQTHSLMFHQMDAVMIDTQTTFADLKGCLDYFVRRLFGNQVETRFRPHYFPFTEPSAEVDFRWKGALNRPGKQAGWLEFGGCGMIHPAVLQRAGLNPRIYQGWAFGMAVERPIMIRKQIPDIRRLFENSLDFLTQFNETV